MWRRSELVDGRWLLGTGCRVLVAGCWQLLTVDLRLVTYLTLCDQQLKSTL
jgi:hypothetical protein